MSNEMLLLIIAIVSAVAACFAAWYTARTAQISNKALTLAEKQDLRRQSNLSIYLDDSYIRHYKGNYLQLYVFHITITNNSDVNNSIKEITLTIKCSQQGKMSSNFVISHDAALQSLIGEVSPSPIRIPSLIEPNTVLTGLSLFRVPDQLLDNSVVESYLLKITDVSGKVSEIEPIFVNEVKDEASS